jgi:pimeloyl-ACP methyl ester carboxylesterase
VRTLTLVSTPVYINERMKNTYSLGHGSRAEAFKTLGREAWLEATNRSTRFPPDTDAGLLAWYTSEFAKNRADAQLAMANLANTANVSDYLTRLRVPVLGLYPTDGPITGGEQERLLRERVGNLSIIHLPSSYHKIQLTFPAACATHLLHFVSQHDGLTCSES